MSAIATLPHAGDMISSDFDILSRQIQLAEMKLSSITRIYSLVNVKNTVVDGDLGAPDFSKPGISLAMKNVAFSYPESESTQGALTDISFSIAAGQLVVIVGANGSGKSTLLKLLTRLYDRTSGGVLVDGKDIRSYKLADLHSATAVLTQDHHIYPLSLGENIGLGNPEQVENNKLILGAAEKGGAGAFIKRFAEGLSTVLAPKVVQHESPEFDWTEDTPLSKKYNEGRRIQKEISVSGGEKQRVVASRTFMRLTSAAIKLVVADEPSSNLDPLGEMELFQNLRDEQKGRTMIFVTHRFGWLVKHADLILCMKDGRLVEQGTHTELMAVKSAGGGYGEYRKLYNIQAQAFAEEHEK
ncbi:P-loop containing nucleoside triphosphate hydrolase protein [Mycena latifolia]|nr:P-loop containing nucleoside triphosphate hydrolase protein [Mycena latifolia]